MEGYYLNDYKDGLTYWEFDEKGYFDSFVLVLKEKPAGELDGKTLYRRRLFYGSDIGKKIFETKEEAQRSQERI